MHSYGLQSLFLYPVSYLMSLRRLTGISIFARTQLKFCFEICPVPSLHHLGKWPNPETKDPPLIPPTSSACRTNKFYSQISSQICAPPFIFTITTSDQTTKIPHLNECRNLLTCGPASTLASKQPALHRAAKVVI